MSKERRAIGADMLYRIAHVAIDMRMVLWRQCADTHELLGADLDDRNAEVVMEMRNDFVCQAGVRNKSGSLAILAAIRRAIAVLTL